MQFFFFFFFAMGLGYCGGVGFFFSLLSKLASWSSFLVFFFPKNCRFPHQTNECPTSNKHERKTGLIVEVLLACLLLTW